MDAGFEAVRRINKLEDEADRNRVIDGGPLCNYSATAAPTTGDDVADGYQPGSIWVDLTNDDAYICLDNAAGAAGWKKITP